MTIQIPELIFGHLLTGTNFDDHSTRITGGSHGYGAKLANIFRYELPTLFSMILKRFERGFLFFVAPFLRLKYIMR
jgi:DNA gyrase/topoisomerase IV subunit B